MLININFLCNKKFFIIHNQKNARIMPIYDDKYKININIDIYLDILIFDE